MPFDAARCSERMPPIPLMVMARDVVTDPTGAVMISSLPVAMAVTAMLPGVGRQRQGRSTVNPEPRRPLTLLVQQEELPTDSVVIAS